MASTFLSLMGMFPKELHKLVTQRLIAISETAQSYETTETFFHRGPDTPVDDSNILRLRSTHLSPSPFPPPGKARKDPIRSLLVFQKPDPISQSPDILSRMLIEAPLAEGDPFALASVLGYSRKASTHQKGLRFQRGSVLIEVFQLYQSDVSAAPLSSSHYIISVSTRCANPRPPPSTTQSNSSNPAGANPSSNPGVASSTAGGGGPGGGAGQGGQTGPGGQAQGGGPQAGPGQYTGPTAHELKLEATARIREVQGVLRGVVDLSRVDV